MSAPEIPQTHSLIDRYYEEERSQREKEQSLAELSLKLDANDLAMLGMIARRFRKTRDDVAQEVLSSALVDLFSRIDASERKLMARDADESARGIADSIAEENGVRDVEFRSGYWAQQDRAIAKIEKQREKAMKQAEKLAEQEKLAAKKASASAAAKAPVSVEDSADEQDMQEDTTHYPETSAIEKAPAALETQVDAANEQEASATEKASAATAAESRTEQKKAEQEKADQEKAEQDAAEEETAEEAMVAKAAGE